MEAGPYTARLFYEVVIIVLFPRDRLVERVRYFPDYVPNCSTDYKHWLKH